MTPVDLSTVSFDEIAEVGIALGLVLHHGLNVRFAPDEQLLAEAIAQASVFKSGVPNLTVNPVNVLAWIRYFEATLTESELANFDKLASDFRRKMGVEP